MSENPWRAPPMLDYIHAILIELEDLAGKADAPALAKLCSAAADEAQAQLALRLGQANPNQEDGEAA
jgi:hypothetical protein